MNYRSPIRDRAYPEPPPNPRRPNVARYGASASVFARHVENLVPQWMQRLRRAYVSPLPRSDRNTVDGARRNIHHHYDLSNDLFALFLDETMTYSSALFDTDGTGAPIASADTLPNAQHRKIDTLLDRVGVGPGTRLLEIGTGWGELAIRAARRGATVHSLTISAEQYELAVSRPDTSTSISSRLEEANELRSPDRTDRGGFPCLISRRSWSTSARPWRPRSWSF